MNVTGESFSDAVEQQVLQRKRHLEDELRRLDEFLLTFREVMKLIGVSGEGRASTPKSWGVPEAAQAAIREFLDSATDVASVPIVTPVPTDAVTFAAPTGRSFPRAQRMSNKAFVALAKEILLESGIPLEKEELLSKIHQRGRSVGGSNELDTLKAKLWRTKEEIVRIPGAGFWPTDIPCPAVSYNPPSK